MKAAGVLSPHAHCLAPCWDWLSQNPLGLENSSAAQMASTGQTDSGREQAKGLPGTFWLHLPLGFLEDASLLCPSLFLTSLTWARIRWEVGGWGGVGAAGRASGSWVCRKVCSHTWWLPLPFPLFDRDPGQAGLGGRGERAAWSPSPPASPTRSPRPGCCFLR